MTAQPIWAEKHLVCKAASDDKKEMRVGSMNLFRKRRAFFRLQNKEINGKELQQTPEDHEDVEDGVHPVLFETDTIQNSSDGVSNTSGQKHEESRLGQNFQGLREKEDDAPSHTDIADHRKDIVFL